MGCMDSILPIAGAAVGGMVGGPMGASIGGSIGGSIAGGSKVAGGVMQGMSADAAAEALQPYSQLGKNAAQTLHRTYFGQGDNLKDFYTSPEFELNQFGLQQGAKDLGYGLSAQGRVPFDASGNLTSGAGMRAYQQGMTGLYGGLFDRWRGALGGFAASGQNAAIGQGTAGMAAGSAYGAALGQAGQAVGGMFGGGTPVQAPTAAPWINPDTFGAGGSSFGGFT